MPRKDKKALKLIPVIEDMITPAETPEKTDNQLAQNVEDEMRKEITETTPQEADTATTPDPVPTVRVSTLSPCPDCGKMLTQKTLNYSHKAKCPKKALEETEQQVVEVVATAPPEIKPIVKPKPKPKTPKPIMARTVSITPELPKPYTYAELRQQATLKRVEDRANKMNALFDHVF